MAAAAPGPGSAPAGRSPGPTIALKAVGLLLAGWSAVLLGLLVVAEWPDGWVHLLQVVPLAAAIILAWRRPVAGGTVLLGVGALLALAYLMATVDRPPGTVVSAELVLFLPPIVAGVLFLVAGLMRRQP